MIKEWNGKLISDMDTDHINNTITYLENRAKTAYKQEEDEVRTTLDRFKAQDFESKTWCDYLPDAYYHLVAERDKRPAIDTGLNF